MQLMGKGADAMAESIRAAGRKARDLATELVEMMQASDVPPEHFEEVIEHLRQLLDLDAEE